jgi:hypothetical protein
VLAGRKQSPPFSPHPAPSLFLGCSPDGQSSVFFLEFFVHFSHLNPPAHSWPTSNLSRQRKPSWPPDSKDLLALRSCGMDSSFPLCDYSIEKVHLLGTLDSFLEKSYVQVGINVWNSHLRGIRGFCWRVSENQCSKGCNTQGVWVGTKKTMGSS